MNAFDLAIFVKDFGGLVVAAVLLVIAGNLLPGRAKWFFWTAGFAILGYETYLRVSNKRLMKQYDAERKSLLARVESLAKANRELEQEAAQLQTRRQELEQTIAELDVKLQDLNRRGDATRAENAQVAGDMAKAREEVQTVLDEMEELERFFNRNKQLQNEILTTQ